MNKSTFIKQLSGKQFKRHIENYMSNEELHAYLVKKYPDHKITEEKGHFIIGENMTYRKEKRQQDSVGTVIFKSQEYVFNENGTNWYGTVPPADQFTDNSFYILDCYQNKIEYTLEK